MNCPPPSPLRSSIGITFGSFSTDGHPSSDMGSPSSAFDQVSSRHTTAATGTPSTTTSESPHSSSQQSWHMQSIPVPTNANSLNGAVNAYARSLESNWMMESHEHQHHPNSMMNICDSDVNTSNYMSRKRKSLDLTGLDTPPKRRSSFSTTGGWIYPGSSEQQNTDTHQNG